MNVLVTTHGCFCKGLLESYEMIAGENGAISVLSLTDQGIGEYTKHLTKVVNHLVKQGQLVILTDIKGGTPFNESYKLAMEHPDDIQIITGVNLPMLLEIGLALVNQSSVEKVMKIGLNAGINAIEKVVCNNVMEEDEEILF